MTSHERGAHAVLDRLLRQESTAAALVRTRHRLAGGNHFTPEFVNAVGQMHRQSPGDWPVHQVACLLDIHVATASGRYARVEVEVGTRPHPDAERLANAAALKSLPGPFLAHLDIDQNAGDEDGSVSWAESIVVTRSTGTSFTPDCAALEPVTIPTAVRPFQVPLEVGTTMPSRTLLHLEEDGGVARWAYGSTDLYILLNMQHPLLGRPAKNDSNEDVT
ncbi:hypothetical protein ACWCPT_29815 [Streptomyces sp. NPDC002308]